MTNRDILRIAMEQSAEDMGTQQYTRRRRTIIAWELIIDN